MRAPELSVVIVSWNVREALLTCLHSLPAAVTPAFTFETIVVDNASHDGTVTALKETASWVRVIANPGNALYTAAANCGLDAAEGRYLLLLNPDTYLQPESIARLLAYAEAHPTAGLLGPRIIDGQGRDDLRTGRHLPTPWSEFLDWSGLTQRLDKVPWAVANLRPGFSRSQTAPVPLLSGACLLFSCHLPASLRRLDGFFPMYGEDVDLCRRVQAGGFDTVLVADAVITHFGGASSRQINTTSALLAIDGVQRYFRRWEGRGAAGWHRCGMAVVAAMKWLGFGLWRWARRNERNKQQQQLYAALWRWAWRGTFDVDRLVARGVG